MFINTVGKDLSAVFFNVYFSNLCRQTGIHTVPITILLTPLLLPTPGEREITLTAKSYFFTTANSL